MNTEDFLQKNSTTFAIRHECLNIHCFETIVSYMMFLLLYHLIVFISQFWYDFLTDVWLLSVWPLLRVWRLIGAVIFVTSHGLNPIQHIRVWSLSLDYDCFLTFGELWLDIMSDREPTRWQHNRIYPHPINPCVYTYDSRLYCCKTVDAHCSNIIKS